MHHTHIVGAHACGFAHAATARQIDFPTVQRANDRAIADDAIRQRPATMRALIVNCEDPAVALAKDGNRASGDDERTSLPRGD